MPWVESGVERHPVLSLKIRVARLKSDEDERLIEVVDLLGQLHAFGKLSPVFQFVTRKKAKQLAFWLNGNPNWTCQPVHCVDVAVGLRMSDARRDPRQNRTTDVSRPAHG